MTVSNRNRMLTTLTATVILCGVAFAQAPPETRSNEQIDRELYQDLTVRLRQIDRDSRKVLDRAMDQARAGGGEADLELQAKMLSLQEARERTMSRLLLVASRYGWTIPDLEPDAARADRPSASPTDEVFAPAVRLMHARFKQEARNIVHGLRLPVISLPPPAPRER